MEYVLGEVSVPDKEKTQELAKYKKGEVRAQRIIVESIKDHHVPFIADLKTSKAMYDMLVKLYSISTSGQKISLRNQLYRIRKPKDEGMERSYEDRSNKRPVARAWEAVSDLEMITCVLNALTLDWSSFATSIYSRKDTTPFD